MQHPHAFGDLNEEQEAVVRNFVAGYSVHDLGAGELKIAAKLVELGAHRVIAVDKLYSHRVLNLPHPTVFLVGEYFEEYAMHGHLIDVAFVSWPEAWRLPGLVRLLADARISIYLGSNFDGVSCGTEELFQFWSRRNVLATVPSKQNTLIVYGNLVTQRRLLPEEYAALHRGTIGYFTYGEDIRDL